MVISRGTAIVFAVAMLGVGYIINDIVDKYSAKSSLLPPSDIVDARPLPPPAPAAAPSDYKKRVIEKVIEAKAAVTGGIRRDDFAKLTREMTTAKETYILLDKPLPREARSLQVIVDAMASTIDGWNGLDGCVADFTKAGCGDKLGQLFYYAGRDIDNPDFDYTKPIDQPDPRFLNSSNTSKENFTRVIKLELANATKRKEKFDVVSTLLTTVGYKVDSYLSLIRQ